MKHANIPQKDPIYAEGYTETASSKALRLHGLARIGIASTDSCMNVDLTAGGYCELFEVIGRIAYELSDEIEDLENIAEAKSKGGAQTTLRSE